MFLLYMYFTKARISLGGDYGCWACYWSTVLVFFSGMTSITMIHRLIPLFENPHETANIHEMVDNTTPGDRTLL